MPVTKKTGMLDIEDILDPFSGSKETVLTRDNAHAAIDWMDKEAKRLGLPETPLLLHIDHELPNAAGGVGRLEGRERSIVCVTEGALKSLFNSPDLNHELPAGLKGLLGHEMLHANESIKGIDTHMMRKIPLFALPLISMLGFELWMRAQKSHREDPSKNVREHLDNITADEKQASLTRNAPWYMDEERSIFDWARQMAIVGGLGLAAGGMITGHMSVRSEFRAIEAEVRAAGSAEIAIGVREKLRKISHELMEPKLQQWLNEFPTRSFMDNVDQVYKLLKQELSAMTLHKHPSHAATVEAMRKAGAELKLQAHPSF